METSREAARIAIESTIAQLKEVVPDVPFDAPVTLHAITPYPQTMQTTFGREVVLHSFGFNDHLTLFPFPAVVCWFTCCSSLVHGMNALHSLSHSDLSHISATGRSAYSQENRFVCTCRFAVSLIHVLQGIQLDGSFGFAPSTLVHQGTEASLGKAKM
jgi:hypothetical protein